MDVTVCARIQPLGRGRRGPLQKRRRWTFTPVFLGGEYRAVECLAVPPRRAGLSTETLLLVRTPLPTERSSRPGSRRGGVRRLLSGPHPDEWEVVSITTNDVQNLFMCLFAYANVLVWRSAPVFS